MRISPALMVTLQTRDCEPRGGEVNYRLKNLKLAQPDAALARRRTELDFMRER